MDIRQLTAALSRSPEFQPALRAAADELGDASPEQVAELIKLIEFALERPQQYAEIRAAAVRDDMVEEGDLPEQFNAQALLAVLVVLYRLSEGVDGAEVAMRRGGLNRVRTLASRGRLGDTMLAHISPEEAALLKARGGAGTLNPETGLPQYFKLKKLIGAILPIALNFIAPGIGTAIGAALGASGTAAAMVGQAVIGGVSAGISGGNVLQGAVLGGLGGGLGSTVGGAASEALGLGLGQTGQQLLGGALVGGATGALTGQGFGRGALMGAAGAGLGAATQGVGSGALGAGVGAGGQMAGNMLTAGYKPKEALAGGALAGLAAGLTSGSAGPGMRAPKPSDLALEGLRAPADYGLSSPVGAEVSDLASRYGAEPAGPGVRLPGAQQAVGEGMVAGPGAKLPGTVGDSIGRAPPGGMSPLKTLGTLSMLSSLAGTRPPEVNQAIQTLNPRQQEYFNRPSIQWDWGKMQTDANMRNMSLAQFMAAYWPQLTSGAYNTTSAPAAAPAPAAAAPVAPVAPVAPAQPPLDQGGGYARGGYAYGMAGGGLSAMARLMRGGGTGRDDTIPARLSDGEYVMDAETVAMLGDGSTKAGAQKLDRMREELRRHKGRALSRGKFSPNARSPLAYLKGA
jgi:hypothetical protein